MGAQTKNVAFSLLLNLARLLELTIISISMLFGFSSIEVGASPFY